MDLPTPYEVRVEVQRIIESQAFGAHPRLRLFLVWLVERRLNGAVPLDFKGDIIRRDFFDQAPLPGTKARPKKAGDSSPNVSVRNLRARLERYYETEGQDSSILITISKGTYVPSYAYRNRPTPDNVAQKLARASLSLPSDISDLTQANIERSLKYVRQAAQLDRADPHQVLMEAFLMLQNMRFYGGRLETYRHINALISPIFSNPEPYPEIAYYLLAHISAVGLLNCLLGFRWIKQGISYGYQRLEACDIQVLLLMAYRHFDEAIDVTQRAICSDASQGLYQQLALIHIYAGRYDAAQEIIESILEDHPDEFGMLEQKTLLLLAQGDYKTLLAFKQQIKPPSDVPFLPVEISICQALAGDPRQAAIEYKTLSLLYENKLFYSGSAVAPSLLSELAVVLGLHDDAVAWLQETIEMRELPFMTMNNHPLLRPLHSHPGFRSLIIDTLKLPLD